MQNTPSVAVVGLGAVGAMTLLSLARRGVTAIGFEQAGLGHDDGAYGGSTRRLRLATTGEHGRQHVGLATGSVRLWRELEQASGQELYLPAGELAVGPAEDPDLMSLIGCLRETDLPHEILPPRDMLRRFPQHVLAEDEIGVYSPVGGVLRSNDAVRAAVGVAQRIGVTVHPNTRVSGLEHRGGRVRVRAAGQSFDVDHVVLTAGPWVAELAPQLRDAVTTRRIVTTWFEPLPGFSFEPDGFPPGFRRSAAGHSYTFIPGVDGTAAKFILWITQRPAVADPSAWDRTSEPETVQATCAALAATLRGASEGPSRTVSYLEGFTADRLPVVGRVSDTTTLLAGFSGSGFAIAPVMGEVAADLALHGRTDHDVAGMALDRFGPTQKEVYR